MNEITEVDETKNDSTEDRMDDDLSEELEQNYQQYLKDNGNNKSNEQEQLSKSERDLDQDLDKRYNECDDSSKNNPEKITCINEKLEGSEHPETGVPFKKRQVEVEGKDYEVVMPRFESKYDAQLPEDMFKASDYKQFKECDAQLKHEVENNDELKAQFDKEQLEQIYDGETPDGYTWHHDAEAGKMQLVDTETHDKTAHTGGRSIWGGGSDNR